MPVQIYLAGGLSTIFGYSLTLLQLSTVGMLALGLASFYGLARELGVTRWTSVAATLALLASPLVLRLGFSFMSDVHFLGWMLAALFLYVRGLRRRSDMLVFLGSIAAACAVGTRQFGLAIVVGLVFAWVVCRPERRPRLRILALAAALPAGAVCYQILIGLQAPNITRLVRLWQEREYLSQPPLVVAHDLLWRATIALQYVGISILPALPLLVAAAHAYVGRSRLKAKQILLLATLIGSTLCAVLLIGGPLTGQLDDDGQRRGPRWVCGGICRSGCLTSCFARSTWRASPLLRRWVPWQW